MTLRYSLLYSLDPELKWLYPYRGLRTQTAYMGDLAACSAAAVTSAGSTAKKRLLTSGSTQAGYDYPLNTETARQAYSRLVDLCYGRRTGAPPPSSKKRDA